ncbi:MAG: tetratricopeptide repeat protein [Deltaproteobacteria bacterium]|nr:tetratricopeptide repeat protein [Deltaproteobacteria bacterium]
MTKGRAGGEDDSDVVDAEFVEVVVAPAPRHSTDDLVRDRPPRPSRPPSAPRRGRRSIGGYGAVAIVATVLMGAVVATIHHARTAGRAAVERGRLLAFYESLMPEAGPSAIAPDFVPRGQVESGGLRSVSLLDAASARVKAELGDDPALESHARLVLGSAYRVLGLGDPARRELGRALELSRAHDGAESRAYARRATALAAAEATGGDVRVAERLLREALAILEKGSVKDEARWLATAELGSTRYRRGDLDGADHELAAALEGLRAHVDVKHAALAVILANLGVIADVRGDLGAATTDFQHGLDVLAAGPTGANPEAAWMATRLAALWLVKGRDAEAQALLETAMDTWGRTVGGDHPSTIVTRARLAQALARQHDAARGEPIAREGLALATQSAPRGPRRSRAGPDGTRRGADRARPRERGGGALAHGAREPPLRGARRQRGGGGDRGAAGRLPDRREPHRRGRADRGRGGA